MDIFEDSVGYVIVERKPRCSDCKILLNAESFKYSDDTNAFDYAMVFDLLCRICGQIGKVGIRFADLVITDLRGNFDFNLTIEERQLQPDEIMEEVDKILGQARLQ